MQWNVPNSLTLFRVISIPFIIGFYLNNWTYPALILLVLSVLTDFFDGHLARRLDQETEWGALFDPIADKLVALSFYGLIAYLQLAPLWFVWIVLARNFAQLMSVPILIWWLKRDFKVRPQKFAKWATAVADIYLFVPLFGFLIFPINERILLLAMGAIAAMEAKILVTYVPRLYQIAVGTHDTFE